MCQAENEGGRRCPTHASGSQAVSYEAEREYGLSENVVRKVLAVFRKEAIHNGISDKVNASAQAVKAFIKERVEAVKNAVNMSGAEKRTAIRRWTRAAKEKVSMATLYSWKKTSALMAAGSMAVLLSACSGTGENTENLPDGDSTPAATASADPTDGATNQGDMEKTGDAFGYDFSTIDVPEDITERYGEEASANLVNDVFVPMQVIKSNQALYDSSEKGTNTYLPLQPYLTPKAWDRELSDGESEEKVENANPVANAYAISCSVQEDGTAGSWYVKEGHEATQNDDDYAMMTCDSPQDVGSNVTIENISIDTLSESERGNDSSLSDVPEHVVVSSTVTHKFTGTSPEGDPVSQEFVQEIRSYMVPDSEKENHWLIDGADWQRDYGKTTYS